MTILKVRKTSASKIFGYALCEEIGYYLISCERQAEELRL